MFVAYKMHWFSFMSFQLQSSRRNACHKHWIKTEKSKSSLVDISATTTATIFVCVKRKCWLSREFRKVFAKFNVAWIEICWWRWHNMVWAVILYSVFDRRDHFGILQHFIVRLQVVFRGGILFGLLFVGLFYFARLDEMVCVTGYHHIECHGHTDYRIPISGHHNM